MKELISARTNFGTGVSPFYLFDLVAGAGDALRDALVCPDGSGEFSIMLDDQLVQIPVTGLEGFLQASLLGLPVLHVIAAGKGPASEKRELKSGIQLKNEITKSE